MFSRCFYCGLNFDYNIADYQCAYCGKAVCELHSTITSFINMPSGKQSKEYVLCPSCEGMSQFEIENKGMTDDEIFRD